MGCEWGLESRLVKALAERGYSAKNVQPLAGGRTNRVFAAQLDVAAVIKLYPKHLPNNPLFPNLPHSEARALQYLSGSGIAPTFIDAFSIDDEYCLIYEFVSGKSVGDHLYRLASTLNELHDHRPLATEGFRQLARTTDDWKNNARNMRSEVRNRRLLLLLDEFEIRLNRQYPDAVPLKADALVHGDCTVANIIETNSGFTLIDWQCPGRGDAVEDYAVLTSPAMHYLSGFEPASNAQISRLMALQDDALTARFEAILPIARWRIACYCAMRSEVEAGRGNAQLAHQYTRAVEYELQG